MANEYKLSHTAAEIDEKLSKLDGVANNVQEQLDSKLNISSLLDFTDEEIEEICDFEEGMNEEDVIPKATKDLLGCVVVGDGLDVDANGVLSNAGGMDLLWQNASPTSDFNYQTISLNLSEYDFLMILHYNTESQQDILQVVPKSGSTQLEETYYVITEGETPYIYSRKLEVSDTGIFFHDGYVKITGNGVRYLRRNTCIPKIIYGIKGGVLNG